MTMADVLKQAEAEQAVAAALGFDWPDIDGAWDKLLEELTELRRARTRAQQTEELGDLLFMLVNLARHLGVDPQQAAELGIEKFQRRFAVVKAEMAAQGLPLCAENLSQMEAAWQHAKQLERQQGDAG